MKLDNFLVRFLRYFINLPNESWVKNKNKNFGLSAINKLLSAIFADRDRFAGNFFSPKMVIIRETLK